MSDTEEFSDEGKSKIIARFDAAVDAHVKAIVRSLNEPIDIVKAVEINVDGDDLSDWSKAEIERLVNIAAVKAITKHLEDAAMVVCEEEQKAWLNENREAVIASLCVEKAEKLENDLLDLFLDHYCYIPQNRINVTRELREENQKLREWNEEVTQAIDATQQKCERINNARVGFERKQILENLRSSQGWTLMDKGRVETLLEGVEFQDADDFRTKALVVYEQHCTKKKTVRADILSEEFDPPPKPRRYETPLVADAARMLG
jgi:hypothetical protein